MSKHIDALLTSLGVPAEDITAINAVPETDQETFDAAPFVEKVKGNYQTQFKNDPTFFEGITLENLPQDVKKKIESAQFGRAANITMDKFLKGLGMSAADIADIPQEKKDKLELLIPEVAERYTKTKTGDKELQQQLIDARKELEKYGPDYETGLQAKYQTEADSKIATAIFNANLIGELSAVPGLKIPAADIAATANQILSSKYAFERVGDFAVELRQKDKPTMKVLKPGTSHEVTLKDALLEIATERGWVEKEKAKEENRGSGSLKVEPKNGELLIVPPHLADKISNKINEEAKA